MDNVDRLIDQIKPHECVELMPYRDTEGLMTIGVGRNIEHNGIRMVEADFMLMNDIKDCMEEAKTYHWYEGLSATRKAVIINMLFNLGKPRFDKFVKFQAALAEGLYDKASTEMLDSRWAKQVGKRAVELSIQMQKDKFQ